jgi:hypothetical protein
MTAERTTTPNGERDQSESPPEERSVEERAEEIVGRVSEDVARFARRLVARAREEAEDIVAEAQSLRRGHQPRE